MPAPVPAQQPAAGDGARHAPQADTRMGGWTGLGYDQLTVGLALPPHALEIDAAALGRFHACLGRQDEASQRIPAFLLNEIRAMKTRMKLPPGVLHAEESLTQRSAAYLGDKLEVLVRIADKYIRNDKRFVVVEQRVQVPATETAAARPVLDIRRILYWPC